MLIQNNLERLEILDYLTVELLAKIIFVLKCFWTTKVLFISYYVLPGMSLNEFFNPLASGLEIKLKCTLNQHFG